MFVETEKRPAGEPAKVGTLKLSEAIRAGAALRPKCTEYMFKSGASCALGAAYEAVYGFPGTQDFGFPARDPRLGWALGIGLEKAFPSLLENGRRLVEQVYKRNDGGQSREQVADWLESQGY